MAHFLNIQTGGIWTDGTAVTAAKFELIDSQLFKAINGDEGGTWAPSSAIIIGGSGLTVSATLTASSLAVSNGITVNGLTGISSPIGINLNPGGSTSAPYSFGYYSAEFTANIGIAGYNYIGWYNSSSALIPCLQLDSTSTFAIGHAEVNFITFNCGSQVETITPSYAFYKNNYTLSWLSSGTSPTIIPVLNLDSSSNCHVGSTTATSTNIISSGAVSIQPAGSSTLVCTPAYTEITTPIVQPVVYTVVTSAAAITLGSVPSVMIYSISGSYSPILYLPLSGNINGQRTSIVLANNSTAGVLLAILNSDGSPTGAPGAGTLAVGQTLGFIYSSVVNRWLQCA